MLIDLIFSLWTSELCVPRVETNKSSSSAVWLSKSIETLLKDNKVLDLSFELKILSIISIIEASFRGHLVANKVLVLSVDLEILSIISIIETSITGHLVVVF